MTAILDELEQSIHLALDDTPRWEQGSIFELDTERQQLRKDHEALEGSASPPPRRRVCREGGDRRHYADPRSRWFPVAVTFLVPASIAKGVR